MFLKILAGIVGVFIIASTIFSVIETFVLPRSVPDVIYQFVFGVVRKVFRLILRFFPSYKQRDWILAYLSPVSLMALIPVWYFLIQVGFTSLFWAVNDVSIWQAILVSGSSLLTLGFSKFDGHMSSLLIFMEATIGLLLVALLMAYLPTIYAAFSRRETLVTMLETRAGNPASVVEMLKRHHRINGMDRLSELWDEWEVLFAEIEESHTSLPSLVFFRSPNSSRNWVNAAGVVMDASAFYLSALDVKVDPQAALCLRSGYIALRSICDTFNLSYDPDPKPDDRIHISREEFDIACRDLQAEGVPLKADLDEAWKNFAGWRVNYDEALLKMAGMVLSPPSPWVGDKQISYWDVPFFWRKSLKK